MDPAMEQIIVNGFTINWSRAELSKGELVKPIEAKHLAILRVLAQANGDIVSLQQMLDFVWPNLVVNTNTVQQGITQLRKLLGDDGRSQKAIKTHPKLGYSLVYQQFKITERTIPKNINTKKNKKAKYWNTLLVLLFALIVLFLTFSGLMDNAQPQVKKITPITVQGEIVQSIALEKDALNIYYLVNNGSSQSLRKQYLHSANYQTLADDLNVYGSISISAKGDRLAYSQMSLDEDKSKCISLYIFNLIADTEVQLLPCNKNYHHSPTWLDDNTIVYISSDKEQRNTLYKFDLKNSNSELLRLGVAHVNSYDLAKEKLAIVADGKLTIFDLATDEIKFPNVFSEPLNFNDGEVRVRWLEDEKLALIHNNFVEIYALNGNTSSFSLLGKQKINDLLAVSSNAYVAILGQQNWNVREHSFVDGSDSDIGASHYREIKAKYNRQDNGISYLSDRSGMQQIWHMNSSGLKQLTDMKSPVNDYIWVFNDTSVLFINDDKLWLQTKNLKAVDLDLEIIPLRLYQADGQYILMSGKLKGEDVLLRFNLETEQWRVLLHQNVNWAQYINEKMFITNDATGKLEKYVDSVLTPISALPNLILQWRYFWRTDRNGFSALYFQDKDLNIWKYDPVAEIATVVGRYNLNALFMTDYSVNKHRMLSDNFVEEQQQLVTIKVSN